jgi:hypothetical protein
LDWLGLLSISFESRSKLKRIENRALNNTSLEESINQLLLLDVRRPFGSLTQQRLFPLPHVEMRKPIALVSAESWVEDGEQNEAA